MKWADFHLSAELLHQHYKDGIDLDATDVMFYHLTTILRFVLEDFAQMTIIQIMFLVNNNSTNPTVITSIVVGSLMSAHAARKAGGAIFKTRCGKSNRTAPATSTIN